MLICYFCRILSSLSSQYSLSSACLCLIPLTQCSVASSVWLSRRGCWGMTLRWVGQRTTLAHIQRGDEGKRWTDKPRCVVHRGLKQLQRDDSSISSSDLPTSSAPGHSIHWHGPECVWAKGDGKLVYWEAPTPSRKILQRSLLKLFWWDCLSLEACFVIVVLNSMEHKAKEPTVRMTLHSPGYLLKLLSSINFFLKEEKTKRGNLNL